MHSDLPRISQPRHLLNQILDQPGLVQVIQSLDAKVLTRLIHHIGLEDCGEIISMATVEQLKGIFDQDLWQSAAPGQDEAFDADRFALWLDVMLETGPAFAAHKIEQLDEDLLVLALCKQILVVDLDVMAVQMAGDDRSVEEDLLDKELESCLSQEFDEYLVISKNQRGWDAVLSLLAELNEQNLSFLGRLLERCCRISTEYIEDNGGLYDVLTTEQMLESDMAADRQERRQHAGFVTPSSAVGFLGGARGDSLERILSATAWDLATRIYFQAIKARDSQAVPQKSPKQVSQPQNAVQFTQFMETLRQARVIDDERRPDLLESADFRDGRPDERLIVAQAMQILRTEEAELYGRRLEEISYLANVLIAGCGYRDRRFRPVEAAEAALSVCSLGIDHLIDVRSADRKQTPAEQAARLMSLNDAIKLFQAGWKILFDQVSLPTARGLYRWLGRMEQPIKDRQQARAVAGLRICLQTRIAAGQPWLFHHRLDELLGLMDSQTVAELMALMNEYPLLPDALQCPQRRPGTQFIANQAQIRAIHGLLKTRGLTAETATAGTKEKFTA